MNFYSRAELIEEMSIEELISAAERSASCEVYGLLKRADEKHVTERAFDNPKFVEDLVDVRARLGEVGHAPELRAAQPMFSTYALGWTVQDYRGAKLVWHGGAVFGSLAAVALLPEKNIGIYIAANSEEGELVRSEALLAGARDAALVELAE